MNTQTQRKNAFLLMPFDPSFNWLRDLILQAAADIDVKVERADDIWDSGVIIDQVEDAIADADAVLAVCTGQNANVFFELGLAWRSQRPILIAERPDDLPFDVKHVRTVCYGGEHDKERLDFAARLRKAIIATVEAGRPMPRGRRLSAPPPQKRVVRLDARVTSAGRNSHHLEFINHGTVPVKQVTVAFPEDCGWQLETTTFASYPVRVLKPGKRARGLLLAGGMEAAAAVEAIISGITADGDQIKEVVELSRL